MPQANCPRCGSPFSTPSGKGESADCPKCLLRFVLDDGAPALVATVHAAPQGLKPGDSFHGLVIEEFLGRGGMGFVYAARQTHLERKVALKVVAPELARDPEFVERFKREARALAALSHPAIVAVHDFGFERDLPFLVMEFVDGTTLRTLIAKKALPPEEAIRIVPGLCEALEYAHSRGVVHRDIKPENILVGRDGRVKIADFGLAKLKSGDRLTQTSAVMGTPHYMAPEQVESTRGVDHRADIYSMGVVIYEMLTGELPIGKFPLPSSSPGVDARLDEIVMKALEKSPDLRFQKASEFGEAISRLVPSGVEKPAAPAVAASAQSVAVATDSPAPKAPKSVTISISMMALTSAAWNWVGLGWLDFNVPGMFVVVAAAALLVQAVVNASPGRGWEALVVAVVAGRFAHLALERTVQARSRLGLRVGIPVFALALALFACIHGFHDDSRWERIEAASTNISKFYDKAAVQRAIGQPDMITRWVPGAVSDEEGGEVWWYGPRPLIESLGLAPADSQNSFAGGFKTLSVHFSKDGGVLGVVRKMP